MNDMDGSSPSNNTQHIAPSSQIQANIPDTVRDRSTTVTAGIVSGSKEREAEQGRVSFAEYGIVDQTKEMELPKEVSDAGVKIQPTSIPLPPQIQQIVVPKPLPEKQREEPPLTLPLTDDQIAQGMKQDLFSSWRWFAEWCSRKLKQMHVALKTVHGKVIRVKT